MSRRLVYWLLLGAIATLYVASVPWYRSEDEPLTLWFGLPDWVATALICYVAVACLNAVAWLLTDVPDTLPTNPAPPDPASRAHETGEDEDARSKAGRP